MAVYNLGFRMIWLKWTCLFILFILLWCQNLNFGPTTVVNCLVGLLQLLAIFASAIPSSRKGKIRLDYSAFHSNVDVLKEYSILDESEELYGIETFGQTNTSSPRPNPIIPDIDTDGMWIFLRHNAVKILLRPIGELCMLKMPLLFKFPFSYDQAIRKKRSSCFLQKIDIVSLQEKFHDALAYHLKSFYSTYFTMVPTSELGHDV
ncbi:hypothetical protein CEXT_168961 [Caerostris extrusa]|uniref:Uncharacterized protein n=1 Tax=Caerostris extrusa TaxID=172846 RepID=A0AAV4PNQ2_CAEEX|nr:hypothetical protein CEXT_168961 [Caerostris extrusa]